MDSMRIGKGEGHGAPAAGDPSPADLPAASSAARAYLTALALGTLMALGAFYLGLGALHVTGNLPPPGFSNSLCVDDKLRFMREHPAQRPDLLIVGSSIALRNFDAEALVTEQVASQPLNGGFCGLRAHQVAYVAGWILDRHATTEHVLFPTVPQDFARCNTERTAVFDRGDAEGYVSRAASPWSFYLKYFSPLSLTRNARKIKQLRTDRLDLDTLVFDRYAAAPKDTPRNRPTLAYGSPERLEDECFDALRSLGRKLQADGRQFTVVLAPIHPAWKAKEDPDGEFMDDFRKRLRSVVSEVNGSFWDADRQWNPGPQAFTDAVHLRWSGAREFSGNVAAGMRRRELLLMDTTRLGRSR